MPTVILCYMHDHEWLKTTAQIASCVNELQDHCMCFSLRNRTEGMYSLVCTFKVHINLKCKAGADADFEEGRQARE